VRLHDTSYTGQRSSAGDVSSALRVGDEWKSFMKTSGQVSAWR